MYLAHDITLVCLLKAIEGYNEKFPVFASTVVFELHLIEETAFVKIFYDDEVVLIPGCKEKCEYESFKNYLNGWIVKDYQKACEVKNGNLFRESISNPFFDGQT